ncbi:hypothetical protein SOVF_208270 [Spinacia oleracea]|nr:hypothetical protein SOVF_208270 [Spinacia oleracea]
MSLEPLLEMQGISKTFNGLRVLKNVGLKVYPGEIHALMGENGAGKSTLMKILSGAYQADPGGEIRIAGQPIPTFDPATAKALGIAVIYQELSLCPNLSVAENIYLGRELRRGWTIDRKGMEAGCIEVLQRLGAEFTPSTRVSNLSIAERQLVEIARALHAHAKILVMDEPTTPLSSRETDRLFALIKQLRSQGLAIIYISHRMAEIYELSDRVSVLRDGQYIGELTREALSAEVLVKMMVGRDLSGFYKKEHAAYNPGNVVMRVRDMADGKRVRNCSFDLHAGEVLGIAGLVGAGRTELARLIFAADPRTSGTLEVVGKTITQLRTPADAIRAGVVYLTEDRKAQGLFLDMSVADNINVNVGALSGGNQQKVLLARLLEVKPHVLILDEPTRGVDIGSKSEIYRIINQLAQAGVGIVVISSELPEIIGTCDRVLIMREGQLVAEVGGASGHVISQERIIDLATGGDQVVANG